MRLGCLVLVATACLLASSEAAFINSNAAGGSSVSSVTTHTRFLRSATAITCYSKDDDEERAGTIAGGLIRDKAATKQWLNSLLQQGKSVNDVKALLNMNGLAPKDMLTHRNWNAYARFYRMKWEKVNGKKMAYADFGSGLQSKENTHEVLLGWIVRGIPVEKVAKYLKLSDLTKSKQLLHPNWRAYKAYEKMSKQYQEGMQKIKDKTQFAFYYKEYRGVEEVEETLTKWAMAGHSIDDIAKTLGVKGLSGAALKSHENYRALEAYKRYFKQLEPIRAAARANARTT